MSEEKSKRGRPALFKDAEELQTKIDEYFESLIYVDSDKQEQSKTPTLSGMAYFLGFCDRQSLYDYKGKDEFSCIIKRSRLFIESYYEENLSGRNPTGSIFWLKNAGWKDKTEVDSVSVNLTSDLTDDEKEKALERVKTGLKEFDDYE